MFGGNLEHLKLGEQSSEDGALSVGKERCDKLRGQTKSNQMTVGGYLEREVDGIQQGVKG